MKLLNLWAELKMKFDFLNLSIIKEFYKLRQEKPSLSKIRDKINPNLPKSQKEYYLCKIRDRIESMKKEDLFTIITTKKGNVTQIEYRLNSEKVKINYFNFPDGKKKGIALNLKDKWNIIEL